MKNQGIPSFPFADVFSAAVAGGLRVAADAAEYVNAEALAAVDAARAVASAREPQAVVGVMGGHVSGMLSRAAGAVEKASGAVAKTVGEVAASAKG